MFPHPASRESSTRSQTNGPPFITSSTRHRCCASDTRHQELSLYFCRLCYYLLEFFEDAYACCSPPPHPPSAYFFTTKQSLTFHSPVNRSLLKLSSSPLNFPVFAFHALSYSFSRLFTTLIKITARDVSMPETPLLPFLSLPRSLFHSFTLCISP